MDLSDLVTKCTHSEPENTGRKISSITFYFIYHRFSETFFQQDILGAAAYTVDVERKLAKIYSV